MSVRHIAYLFAFFLSGLRANAIPIAPTKPPSFEAVTKKLDELYRSSSSLGRMELLSKTETQSRHLKMRVWSKGKDKTLIIIDEPAREAGIATLRVGENIWNYLPKISKTIRIPPSMMLSSWMNTDFTNDDLVKETSYQEDFTAAAAEKWENPKGWRFVMTVKPGIVGRWNKIDWVVSEETWLPLEAKYYDRKNRLARIMRFSEVKKLGGKEIPTHLVLESVDQPDRVTTIRYLEMTFNAQVPDSKFSLSELERK